MAWQQALSTKKTVPLVDDLEHAVAENIAFHFGACAKQVADEVSSLHATDALQLKRASKFEHLLGFHRIQIGYGEPWYIRIDDLLFKNLLIIFVRSFAIGVLRVVAVVSLSAIVMIGAIAALRPVLIVSIITTIAVVSIVPIIAVIAVVATEFTLTWLASL
jgi:hypothetical protein